MIRFKPLFACIVAAATGFVALTAVLTCCYEAEPLAPSLRDRALAPRSRGRDKCYFGPRAPLSQSLCLIDRPVFILTPLCLTIGINISNLVHRDSINVSDRHIQIALVIVILTHDVTNGKNECFRVQSTGTADFIPFRVIASCEAGSIIHDLSLKRRILAGLACGCSICADYYHERGYDHS